MTKTTSAQFSVKDTGRPLFLIPLSINKRLCRGGVIGAIFANIELQIPKKSFGGNDNSVDFIDNHAEIMCLLLAHSEIILRDHSP